MTDAREAPSPPRLRWATKSDCGVGILVQDDGLVASTTLSVGFAYGKWIAGLSAFRPAVIAEPLDLQAVAEEIYLAVCGPPVELRTHHQDVSHSKYIAAIVAVLEKYL